MKEALRLTLGVKTDPIEYRYSFRWLFRLLAEEGVYRVQLGSFFELYQLPERFFAELRDTAGEFEVEIASLFTSHRELGGFFRDEPGFVDVARKNYERMIWAAARLGAKSAGSNPGAVLRDRMNDKRQGVARYLKHMMALRKVAGAAGLEWLTIEPMSCLAEPPTTPDEMAQMMEALAFHRDPRPGTARVGFCGDTSHGYADADKKVVWDNMTLLEACLPYLYELHLKNTDRVFDSTFGFGPDERKKGIVDIPSVRSLLLDNAGKIPVDELTAYLEIGGPKTGRDYSDPRLEKQLRESLSYLRDAFVGGTIEQAVSNPAPIVIDAGDRPFLAPSIMCCDHCALERDIRAIETVGADLLHVDIMDARFTPNMPLGLETIRQLKSRTALPFDVHLMVEDNAFFIEKCLSMKVERISVHVESCRHLDRVLAAVRDGGALAGAALNPSTPLSALEFALERLDFVVLMTVNPGFAGQPLAPCAFRKIAACRGWLDRMGLNIPIEVDGNVSFENIPRMVAAGADILVAGTSSLFRSDADLRVNADRARRAVAEGLALRSKPRQAA